MSLNDELLTLLKNTTTAIEQRKELISRVWAYQPVDHIPVLMSVDWLPWPKTYREELETGEVQLRNRLHTIKQSLELLPDDYIPSCFIDLGCVGIAEAFGGEVFLGEDPDQTPGIGASLIKDRGELEVLLRDGLKPDFSSGLAAEYLRRLSEVLQLTDRRIYVSGLDFNGPLGVAMDLLGSSFLFELLIEEDPLLEHLLATLTDAILHFTGLMIERAGSADHFTSLDFFWYWCPVKGHVSSDLSAMYSGNYFDRIERPFLTTILEKYGGGLLHNCGPNPCTEQYARIPHLRGLNVSYRYSRGDLALFRRFLKGRVVYFFMDQNDERGSLNDFRHIMEELAPEVIGIPIVSCLDPAIDSEALYADYRLIAEEYAHRMFG